MKDFLTSFELSSALLGLNPSIEKDIRLIEQATTATLHLTQSPKSLRTLDSLQHIDENVLKILKNRGVLTSYEYLSFENNQLSKKIVLIRPNSLKMDDVERIKKLCDESSAISFLNYLYLKEKRWIQENQKLGEQIKENIVYSKEINRSTILDMILRFETYSIESHLDIYDLEKRILLFIIQKLENSSQEVYNYFINNKELSEEVKQFLLDRGDLPLLVSIRDVFHLLFPNFKYYVHVDEEGNLKILKTELDYLKDAAKEIFYRLAKFLSPEKDYENANFNDYYFLFSQHPSLQSNDTWPNLFSFINSVEKLIKLCENLDNLKKDILIENYLNQFIKNLNMNFEPYFFSLSNFQIPDMLKKYINEQEREKIYKIIVEKLSKNKELIVYRSKLNPTEQGYYVIFKYNIPKAFIENANRRSFIHLMLKNSGYPSGIYDFVLDTTNKSLPDLLLKEQQQLNKAIKEWEKEIEKKNKKGILQIIFEWILKLLGILKDTSIKEQVIKETVKENNLSISRSKKTTYREYIPEYRLKKIPEKIEKAIGFIERQYNGLIWIDELSYVLEFKDLERLNSIIYYDKDQRFLEIKPLKNIKPLFIRKENLQNQQWVQQTIDFLKNSSNLPHQVALLEFLENYKNNL
jgi:hypothetical protein